MTAAIELIGITKRFPGVIANDNVNLRVEPGEIHAICGENGAGKSTLMNVLAGTLAADSGTLLISEQDVSTGYNVSTANRFVWMAGYSLKGWTMNQDFVNALKIRTPSLEFEFRTLLMSPDNPSMKASMKSDDIYESAAQSTMVAQKSWKRVHDQLGGAKTELRVSRSKSINYQMVLTDKEALVIPYLTSRDTLRSPYIYARKESFYYEALVEEYEFLWSHSEPVAQKTTSPSKTSKKSGK